MTKNKRLITEKQEEALKLCHHDFENLTQAEAAEQMGITQAAVHKLLVAVEKVLPDYFPILTKLEAKCYHYYMIEGWEVSEIAEHIEKSLDAIYKALQGAKAKGKFFRKKRKMLQYRPWMDAHVKEQF